MPAAYMRTPLQRLIRGQGRSTLWCARKLGISGQHMSRLASGQRRLQPAQRATLSTLLGIPEEVIETLAAETRRAQAERGTPGVSVNPGR